MAVVDVAVADVAVVRHSSPSCFTKNLTFEDVAALASAESYMLHAPLSALYMNALQNPPKLVRHAIAHSSGVFSTTRCSLLPAPFIFSTPASKLKSEPPRHFVVEVVVAVTDEVGFVVDVSVGVVTVVVVKVFVHVVVVEMLIAVDVTVLVVLDTVVVLEVAVAVVVVNVPVVVVDVTVVV